MKRIWKIETEMRLAKYGERYIVKWDSDLPIIGIASSSHGIIPTDVIVSIEEVQENP